MASEVRKYKVVKDGYETILKLNDTDVKLYPNAELVDDQTDDGDQADTVDGKSRTASNKVRRPASDKSGT